MRFDAITDRRSRSSVTGGTSAAMEPRSMTAFRDLRDYIERLRRELGEGAVVKIDGAHWDREIGCLSELTAERERPALLFDNIVGYSSRLSCLHGFHGNACGVRGRAGTSVRSAEAGIVRAWKEKSKRLKLLPPREVESGPVMENSLTGDAVDLARFPAPKWNPPDGGRYIGTADMVIPRPAG
jgi:UbiD family decarboxylase